MFPEPLLFVLVLGREGSSWGEKWCDMITWTQNWNLKVALVLNITLILKYTCKAIMNPNWKETDQLAIYQHCQGGWTWDYQEPLQVMVGG